MVCVCVCVGGGGGGVTRFLEEKKKLSVVDAIYYQRDQVNIMRSNKMLRPNLVDT